MGSRRAEIAQTIADDGVRPIRFQITAYLPSKLRKDRQMLEMDFVESQKVAFLSQAC